MRFEVTILGSNSALPTTKRFPTAQVLNVLERFFLIDCGEGTQIQMKRFRIPMSRINHILISHMHGDHIFGLIGLLSTFSLQGRKSDLHIYGHSKLEKLIRFQFELLETKLGYEIYYHTIFGTEIQTLFEDDSVIVQSFPLKHGVMPCAGFLFKEKERPRTLKTDMINFYNIPIKNRHGIKQGEDFIREDGEVIPNKKLTKNPPKIRRYAFCTDTAYLPKIAPIIESVDLLYHEATFLKSDEKRAKKTYHSTAEQAAKIAKEAKVKKLLIGHFSARFDDLNEHLKEAKKIFPNTALAEDGRKFSVELDRD
ncbi:ribonuclease Z [Labilibaculum antarcticum]|uniref:Ribonuclease Z n=1 Tax=Labilibaculum antarcticum TaxID=1717717 RepID=A0A1Y1CQ34_9BACT|nr:ribonuclease Z [Labilibaculum antarcticum]BAX81361.1 ribonuclease Z [Labilibaculum antarcticum]